MVMKMLQCVCSQAPIRNRGNSEQHSFMTGELAALPAGDSMGHCLVRLGDRAHISGRFGKALLSYKRALRIFEKQHQDDPSLMIICLNKISQVCREQGLYHESEFSARRALSIVEERLEDRSELGVVALTNLGAV